MIRRERARRSPTFGIPAFEPIYRRYAESIVIIPWFIYSGSGPSFWWYERSEFRKLGSEGRWATRRPCRRLCHFLRCSGGAQEPTCATYSANNALFHELGYADALYGTADIIAQNCCFSIHAVLEDNSDYISSVFALFKTNKALVSVYDYGTFSSREK